MIGELERDRRAREAERDRDDVRGTPGRSTLTSRLPPTAGSFAGEAVRESHVQANGDLDGPDVHAVAAHGLTGSGSSLPFLDQIQRAFGHHDISGVRAHIGGAAGEASAELGARAYASGDSVAFAAAPDLHLAAHEAAHVVQQRGGVRLSGGVGRAGDEYEVNADAVADRVVRGESAQALLDPFSHRGAAGGPAVQRDEESDRAWLATLHRGADGHWTAADGRELSAGERRRLHRILRGSGGAARAPRSALTEAVDAAESHDPSHPERALERTELDEDRERAADETGSNRRRGRHGGDDDSARGGRTRTRERLADGSERRVDEIDETRTQDRGGVRVERRERGRRVEEHVEPTFALDLRDRLVRSRGALTREERRASTDAERETIRERRRQLEADITALSAPVVSRETARTIAERRGITVLAEEDVRTTTTITDVNPLDGSVGRGRRREHSVERPDGSARSTVSHESTTVDLGDGAVEHARDVERSRTAADGSETIDRTSRSTRGAIGDGRVEASHRSLSERETTTADGTERRTATERSTSGGAIVTEDETGVRLGRTSRTEEESDGTTRARETATAVELTDRRVGASRSDTREVERGRLRGSARASADGSFSIDVEPMDDGSGRFRLTFTIHVGVGGRLSGSRRPEAGRDGARASASARGSAAGDLISSRVISESDAQRYLDAADRADRGETVSDPPEFGRLARLRAAGEGADALLHSGAVLGDGGAAAAMENGDSITLDTTLGVGGDVSVGGTRSGFGADVEAGGDARWRRTVQVERIAVRGEARVRVTVTYHDATEAHAGGSASLRGVGAARGRIEEEAGATDSVQFVIDPTAADYDERYRSIVQTIDRDQLHALERRYSADVRRSRHAETGAEETEYEVGPTSDAMIGMRSRTTSTDDVTVASDDEGNPVELEARVEGGSDRDVRLRARGHDIDLGGHSESVSGRLDAVHGMRVDVEARDQSIDPAAALGDAAHDFGEADARGRVAAVVARTPAEHLRHALREFDHTWGYHLDEADLTAMSERAGDSGNWSACCTVPDRDVIAAWTRLRGALAHPRPTAAETRVDAEGALHLARVRALSAWMQAASGRGAECLERVLRRWGETRTHEVSADRLGAGYEWPVSLRAAHTSYDSLLAQASRFRDRMEAALARPAGSTEAQAHFTEVSTGFDTVLGQVRRCADFRSEARRSELIREIEQHRAEVHVRYRDFQRRWGELHAHDVECGGEVPTSEAIAATRATGAEITAERSRAYVRAAIRVLQGNHTRETHMLQQVQAIMRDVGDSTYVGHRERAEAATLCSQIHDLHRTWIQQIQDLRQAYTQARIAEGTWQVSTGPGARRNRELEPNVGWLIIEYSRVMRNGLDAYWQGRVAEWRQEGQDY